MKRLVKESAYFLKIKSVKLFTGTKFYINGSFTDYKHQIIDDYHHIFYSFT